MRRERFAQLVGAVREIRTGNMTEETRLDLVEKYAARAEECERRAYWESFVLEAPDMGAVRRCWRRCKLYLYRRGERAARADVERMRGR